MVLCKFTIVIRVFHEQHEVGRIAIKGFLNSVFHKAGGLNGLRTAFKLMAIPPIHVPFQRNSTSQTAVRPGGREPATSWIAL